MAAKIWIALAVEFLIFAALLFGPAGTLKWPEAWAFLALFFGGAVLLTLSLARHDPALLAERMKSPLQKGQPLWDKLFLLGIGAAWCGWLTLMAFDAVRFRWSSLPLWIECLGAVGLVVSFWMMYRVFRENTYLAPVVRIQQERGHHVISTGPYAIIRHPLYAAALLCLPAIALLLGSVYGLLGAAIVLNGAIVLRTSLEDTKLHRDLPGYAEYAARVRYRLLPFVW